jgi:hypothetical protein
MRTGLPRPGGRGLLVVATAIVLLSLGALALALGTAR